MINSTIEELRRMMRNKLPGDEAHLQVIPMKSLKERKQFAQEEFRNSAVSIVLHATDGDLKCILIQRPDYNGAHGGQVSFPGGKMDPEDNNLIHTAIRECKEEIDLQLEESHLIGRLSEVFIPVSRFKVHPYVFYVPELPHLSPDRREVDAIIDFELTALKKKDVIKRTNIRLHETYTLKDVPYFDIANKVVWGATAMIIAELRELLSTID